MYRARQARQEYSVMVARHNVLRKLEAAAGSGHLEAAKEALQLAGGLGEGGCNTRDGFDGHMSICGV